MFNDWKSDYINAFLTLRCNNACPYCINHFAKHHYNEDTVIFEEQPWEKWVEALRQFPVQKTIILNGGEALLFPGIVDLVNSLPDRLISIGTNLLLPHAEEMFSSMRKDLLHISLTLHPLQPNGLRLDDVKLASERFVRLKELGYLIQPQMLDYPGFTDEIKREISLTFNRITKQAPFFGQYGADFYSSCNSADPFSGKKSSVLCAVNTTPISPDGNIYPCHYLMYTGKTEQVIGNVFDGWYSPSDMVHCRYYGVCNPCDFQFGREILFLGNKH